MGWPNTSRHARGYGASWTKLRSIILRRDAHLCQPCLKAGRKTLATQVDHVTPKVKGGTDDRGNLQAICGPCHVDKTARESAAAQGKTYRPKAAIGGDGWPS